MLKEHLKQFKLALKYKQEDVAHLLLPKKDVVFTYVVEDGKSKEVTDFISFYRLPSQILNAQSAGGHTHINSAYLLFNVTTKNSSVNLMKYALYYAKESNFDVFNSLDIMNNEEFLHELKFAPGDGYLHYYLYNWSLK